MDNALPRVTPPSKYIILDNQPNPPSDLSRYRLSFLPNSLPLHNIKSSWQFTVDLQDIINSFQLQFPISRSLRTLFPVLVNSEPLIAATSPCWFVKSILATWKSIVGCIISTRTQSLISIYVEGTIHIAVHCKCRRGLGNSLPVILALNFQFEWGKCLGASRAILCRSTLITLRSQGLNLRSVSISVFHRRLSRQFLENQHCGKCTMSREQLWWMRQA